MLQEPILTETRELLTTAVSWGTLLDQSDALISLKMHLVHSDSLHEDRVTLVLVSFSKTTLGKALVYLERLQLRTYSISAKRTNCMQLL